MKKLKRLLVLCLVAAMCLSFAAIPARAAVFSAADAESYITQLYNGLMGRSPDTAGMLDYQNRMVNGKATAAQIAEIFVSSTEFRARQLTNREYVKSLYEGLLGRTPAESEVDGFIGAMDVGKSRSWVFQQVIGSQEFKNHCEQDFNMYVGSYSTGENTPNVTPTEVNTDLATTFVKRLYTELLGREADTEGLNYWVNQLKYKKMTVAGVAASIAAGSEFNAKSYTDEQFVTAAYKALLARDPDQGGLNSFVNALRNGKTRAWVFAAICASQEFQNRYGTSYGGGNFGEMNATPGTITSTTQPNSLISGAAVNESDAANYVRRLYMNFVNRNPSDADVAHWVAFLTNRTMSAAGVAAAIASSAEAHNQAFTREQYIERLYSALLDRAPDTVGMGTYTAAMANGYSRAWVFAKICQSAEFQNRAEYRNMNVTAGYINSASYDMG